VRNAGSQPQQGYVRVESLDARALVADLAATSLPLAEARTLPGQVYTAAGVLALETRSLFGSSWLAVAREEDFPDEGSFITREVAGERVLVVRGEDAKLRAFFNVCRHRGSRLVDESSGRLRGAIPCPYHAWTYGLDGSLRRTPRMERGPATDGLTLAAMPLATWGGFVSINLDPQAAPFAARGLPDLGRYRLDRVRRVRCLDYEVGANWKIVCENYSECYHCPLVHPQLHRVGDITSGGFEAGADYNGGPMQLRDGFTTMSMSGNRRAPLLAAGGGADDRWVYYYLVYPNLMIGVHPEYLLTHTVWPLTPSRCSVRCELFFAAEALSDAGFDPADAIGFWDLTNRQDWALCERVQQGTASRGYRQGPYHPSERCVHAFDRWYAQWLADVLRDTR
jgi:Rieske 2Fe-2S family protein